AVNLLPRAELVDLRDEHAPAPVRSEQLVECVVGAPAPERGAERLRVVTGGAEVDHARESRYASSTWATPSSSTEGQTKSARSFTRSCALATATPKPAQSTSSRSFSPSPKATVPSREKPRCSATNASPLAFVTS